MGHYAGESKQRFHHKGSLGDPRLSNSIVIFILGICAILILINKTIGYVSIVLAIIFFLDYWNRHRITVELSDLGIDFRHSLINKSRYFEKWENISEIKREPTSNIILGTRASVNSYIRYRITLKNMKELNLFDAYGKDFADAIQKLALEKGIKFDSF
jgi:hypothetical protein